MNIYEFDDINIKIVAKFMSTLKPEWWDFEGAKSQLRSGFGWYIGISEDQPLGWILCKNYDIYRTTEIECLGFDDSGLVKIDKELQPLVEKAEEWSIDNGQANIRFIIGSRGLSCHGKDIKVPWKELKDLKCNNRPENDWFLSMGYTPSGILSNIYGDRFHGVILIKHI